MAESKAEEKVVRQPEVSKVQVMELVQYMARPLKELERQFHEYKDYAEKEREQLERDLAQAQVAISEFKAEINRLDSEVLKANSESMRGFNEAKKYADLPLRVVDLEKEIEGVLEQARIGDEVRHEQKMNMREIDRLQKSLNGCSQSIDKNRALALDVEQQHKEQLKGHAAELKILVAEVRGLHDDASKERHEIEAMFNQFRSEEKNREQSLFAKLEQQNQAMGIELRNVKMDMRKEMQQVSDLSKQAMDKVQGYLVRFDEECDAMSVARKNIHVLEKRMDKVVSIVKEMKAHFELED